MKIELGQTPPYQEIQYNICSYKISVGYIKLEGCRYFYFDLDVTLTFRCDIDFINEL